MKVIFLDFDGVLNGTADEASFDPDLHFASIEWFAQQYDADKVRRLNTLVKRTGAVVVLSTSWRVKLPIVHMARVMQSLGFEGWFFGATPHVEGARFEARRPAEIQAWLDAAGDAVEKFVVLDDMDMGPLNAHLVRTPETTGLRDEDVERAVEMLR